MKVVFATGYVDFILKPESMPATTKGYVKQARKMLPKTNDDKKSIEIILSMMKDVLPPDFSEYTQNTVSPSGACLSYS